MDNNELLKYAVENDMINLSRIEEQINMAKRQELLEQHPYAIWKGKDGRWCSYIPDDKGRKMIRKPSKKEIEDTIVNYWKQQLEIHTLESVFYEWVAEKLKYGEIEKNTYDRYETDFIRYFRCGINQKDIKTIDEVFLEDFIKSTICDMELTAKAYSGMRTLILGIFKYGKKHGYTDLSIYTFFGDLNLSKKIFRKKIRCPEKEVFSEEEISKIVAYISQHEKIRELGVLLAINTGMRVGELSALKRSDIDLKNKTIHIQRSEVKYKDEDRKNVVSVKEFPKTEAGDRYLLLNDIAYDAVKKIIRLNPFGDFLFQDETTGKRISENGFNHKLRRICEAVHIPARSMHKLRKTYGTTLLDSHVDESIIMEQMGHADIKTTRQYYYYSNKRRTERLEQLNKIHIG